MTCANAAKAFKVQIIQPFVLALLSLPILIGYLRWLSRSVFEFIVCFLKRSHENTYYLYRISIGYENPYMELSHILPSCLKENVSKQRGVPIICIYLELSQVSVKFCICTWFAPNFPQVQYGGEELTEKGSKFAISKWTNTGFPNEQIHFSKPTNKSVETFPNEFPSPRQHLLHPGTMGKSHTQHPNIRQLPIAPQVQKTLIFTETSKWNVPQFSFLQGQLYIHVMKINNPLKNSWWGLLGLIFSGAM